MNKHFKILLLFAMYAIVSGCAESRKALSSNYKIDFKQITTDSLFNSNQIISLLTIPKKTNNKFRFNFGYSPVDLQPTSTLGSSKNAIAAINGGFFDMDSTISVTYFEVNDTIINKTRPVEQKGGLSRKIMNGAIIISKDNKLSIQKVKSDQFYQLSKEEAGVLVSGPLLLINSKKISLPDVKFVRNRHPRTCVCKKEKSIALITIDGRRTEAEGMSLYELQNFLQSIKCIDAINLDGGGSTTMWVKDRGVVNFPSDSLKERPVSNALLVKHR